VNPGVGIHYADDAGVFGPRVQLMGDSNYGPATGDFNRDGRPDLAATTVSGGSVTSVWLSRADGGFEPRAAWPAGTNANEATVADFNNDGVLDVLGSNYTSNSVTVLLGLGAGQFSAPITSPAGNGSAFHAVADFNGDGRLDVVTANFNGGNFSLLWGLGTGGFVRGPDYTVGGSPLDAVAGDFNRDGKMDVAVTRSGVVLLFFGR
jgi:hypothetical protein